MSPGPCESSAIRSRGHWLTWPRICIQVFFCCASLLALITELPAQPRENPATKTQVEVEILTPSIGVSPLHAQRWRSVLQEVGADAQMRQPLTTDKIGISEQKRGTLRIVKVVGKMNADGSVQFPGKQFSTSDSQKLAAWLSELKVYGAQGSPDGQPRYGLSTDQFAELVKQLSSPVTQSTREISLEEALHRVPLPAQLPLVFHDSASEHRGGLASQPSLQELQGLAAGTSLAYLLAQHRLGFRPLRTPAGGIQLVVEPLANLNAPWPIGGAASDSVPRDRIFPKLFAMVETGVENTALPAVLEGVEKRTDVRILIDRAACEAREVKVDDIAVNYPQKRTAWALIVNAAVVGNGLLLHYQQDEAGTGFLLVSPYQPLKPSEPAKR